MAQRKFKRMEQDDYFTIGMLPIGMHGGYMCVLVLAPKTLAPVASVMEQ